MKEGYKKTELGWIPEEWQIKKLGDIFEFNGGMSISREKLVDEGVNYLHYGDIHKRNKNYIDVTVDKTWLPKIQDDFNSIKDTVKLTDGDVVFADASEDYEGIGKSVSILNKDNEEFVSGLHTIIAKDIYKSLDRQFKRFCFSTNDIRKQFRKLAVGTSVYGISKENIKKIYMPIPTLKEQEKISDILSSVDYQIEDIDKLIEKTKELKRGLIQRLLTKGIGHKEFKKSEVGEIPKSWDVKELIDISLGKGEYGIGAAATEYENGRPRYLRITDIGDSCDLLMEDIKGVNDEKFSDYLLKENDIVFARTGNTTGKSYVYNKNDGVLVYAGFLIKFSIDPLKCNVKFLKYIVQSKRYWDWVKVMSTRSGQPGINSAEYSKFNIQLPSVSEQNKIEEILSSIDSQIEEYENKRVKLEEVKKGLMQQLLTGKLRVI